MNEEGRAAAQRHRIGLAAYVRQRNGVSLGARGSMGNMLRRSLGAGSFAGFWRHWNPIWSYGLSRYVFAPASRIAPPALALLVTFAVSGLIHDAVITALRQETAFVFTPWFLICALGIIAADAAGLHFRHLPWAGRAAIHLACLGGAFALSVAAMRLAGLEQQSL